MLRKGQNQLFSQVDNEEEKQVCMTFKGQLFAFIRDLDAMMKDRKLGKSEEFLEKMAKCVTEINTLTESAYMCGEDMEVAAQLIQNILTQPLKIQNVPKDVHLLSAAERFLSDKTRADYFARVMVSCVHNAKETESLLRSLKIIAFDM